MPKNFKIIIILCWHGALLGLGGISLPTMAANLGTYGTTYEIAEADLLVVIKERLTQLKDDGELDNINAAFRERVTRHTYRPTPLSLTPSDKERIFYYTPQVKVPKNIMDTKGHIIAKAGTIVNALTYFSDYKPQWLFFNGDSKQELCFAKATLKQFPRTKVILTGGDVRELEKSLARTIYFDQQGRITQKLGIRHVPAFVMREGDKLKVHEAAKKDLCHEA